MTEAGIALKRCSRCRTIQDIREFAKGSRGRLQSHCRACEHLRYRAKHPAPPPPPDLPGERWREVPSASGAYQVSNLGRVRRSRPGPRTRVGLILSQSRDHRGYARVGLWVEGKNSFRTVHSLVAEAFIGPRPTGLEVNHKDGDKLNNQAENLEYMTRLENEQHAARLGLTAKGERHMSRTRPEALRRGDDHYLRRHPEQIKRGANNPRSRMSEAQVASVKARLAAGESAIRIARDLSVSEGLIQGIKQRRTWRHVPWPD
jgi:hypothetical protein